MAPADLGDIKIAGKPQLGTHPFQLRSLDGPVFQAQPDLIQGPRVLAEAVMSGSGRLDLVLEIGWQRDLQPAWQCGLPSDEFPFSPAFAVFAAQHERSCDLDLGSQQVFPLVPCTVPECMEGGRVEPEPKLATSVA